MILKKLTLICLLLLIMMPVINSLWLTIAGFLHKIQVKEQLENAYVQTIEINASKVTWVEKDKEVLIEGKLFDIKSAIRVNDKLVLTGLFDTVEDEIKLRLNQLENTGQKNEKLPAVLLVQFVSPVELLNNQPGIKPIPGFSEKHYSEYVLQNHPNPPLSTSTPPPNT